jgi:hypothetical protein
LLVRRGLALLLAEERQLDPMQPVQLD